MATPSFDTLRASRKLQDTGMSEASADGVVEVLEEATSPLVTREILRSELEVLGTSLRSEMYRALWIQGGVIVTVNAAIMTAVVTLAMAFGRLVRVATSAVALD